MFKRDDFNELDKEYFDFLLKSAYYINLKSKNTGHIWSIYSKQINSIYRSLEIQHKHKDRDPFHVQLRWHPKSIKEAQDKIKSRDRWQLAGRP